MNLTNALTDLQTLIFDQLGSTLSPPRPEIESSEYGACDFSFNNLLIKFRIAKITPTKNGQFVTLWKRIGNGPIMPFESTDSIDFFVIFVKKDANVGLFIFPKSTLCQKGVVTFKNKEGKRAIRVYPAWDAATSKQAQQTQKWQLDYFLEIPQAGSIDIERVRKLFR